MWLFFCYTIQLITIKLCAKFQSPNSSGSWEIFDRKNVYMYYIREKEGKNENLKKEGKMRISILIFIYTVHFAIKLCAKFQSPNSSGSWEIFDRKNVYMYYIREKEGKNENLKKEGKMRISILIFIYTVHFAILKMYTKFENTHSNRSWDICDRNFHWRERKMNK